MLTKLQKIPSLARLFSKHKDRQKFIIKNKVNIIRFDKEGKSLIFEHGGGEKFMRWTIRGVTLLTVLCIYQTYAEFYDPCTLQ